MERSICVVSMFIHHYQKMMEQLDISVDDGANENSAEGNEVADKIDQQGASEQVTDTTFTS